MILERLDVYFWALLIVAGFTMYYVYIVVNPTFEILNKQDQVLEYQANQTEIAIEQNDRIIENQNANREALEQVIKEGRVNQEQQVYYLLTVLNQSNIIGNHTAELILQSINQTSQLQQNLSESRRAEAKGFLRGLSLLLEDTDEELDDIKTIMLEMAKIQNLTLAQQVLRDEYQLRPEDNKFTFPNGTTVNLTDLFRPAVLLTAQGQEYNDTSGQISSYLGGPMIMEEEPTATATGNISGFLGGTLVTNKSIEALLNSSTTLLPYHNFSR